MSRQRVDHMFKILLLGDSGAGKTSILCRFCNETFDSTFISTIGIDFSVKTIELRGKKVRLQIWDTAGQERYHSITTAYYRGATGIVLIYDITQPQSFDNVTKWLRSIADNGGQNQERELLLVGNKCDLEPRRAIAKERGSKLARQFHISRFLEVSAKANINVDEAFLSLADAILEKVLRQKTEEKQQSGAVMTKRRSIVTLSSESRERRSKNWDKFKAWCSRL